MSVHEEASKSRLNGHVDNGVPSKSKEASAKSGARQNTPTLVCLMRDLVENEDFAKRVFRVAFVPQMVAMLRRDGATADERRTVLRFLTQELLEADGECKELAVFAISEVLENVPFSPTLLQSLLVHVHERMDAGDEPDPALMIVGIKLGIAIRRTAGC